VLLQKELINTTSNHHNHITITKDVICPCLQQPFRINFADSTTVG